MYTLIAILSMIPAVDIIAEHYTPPKSSKIIKNEKTINTLMQITDKNKQTINKIIKKD